MKEIMEQYGSAFITMAVSLVLIVTGIHFYRDGGLLNGMVQSYLLSICG